MNIPTYVFPTLRIGSTFDCNICNISANGSDIFPPDTLTETVNVNSFSFRYKIVKTSEEVNELLNLPCDLPLRIKANLLKADGPGKYINDHKTTDGKTEFLVVMKCTTISKKMDDSVKPNEDVKSGRVAAGIGTHYVRRISYGDQMVASIKINTPSTSGRIGVTGCVEGELNFLAVDEALSNHFDILSAACKDATDIVITSYTTEKPDEASTLYSLEDLKSSFLNLACEEVNNRKDIPLEAELQPIETLIPTANAFLPNRLLASIIEEVESRFDDIRNAQFLLREHLNAGVELDEDMKAFNLKLEEVSRIFMATISKLNLTAKESQFDDCLMAYEDALEGYDEEGKFVRFWKKMLLKNKVQASNIQLPHGRELTIAITGKTGVGKSATANSIVGKQMFVTSAAATSASSQFQHGRRTDERAIRVLDVPGFPGTDLVKEIPRILELAPNGFDAILIVTKYGNRFTVEDAQALQLLRESLGEGTERYIILVVSYGDQAEHEVQEDKLSVSHEGCVDLWLETSPDWVQMFIDQIERRVVLFNNRLKPDKHPEAYERQLSKLITLIDGIAETTPPYLLSVESREDLKRKIEDAVDNAKKKRALELEKRKQESPTMATQTFIWEKDSITQRKPASKTLAETGEDDYLVIRLENEETRIEEKYNEETWFEKVQNMIGGCFPASAVFVDSHQQLKRMDTLEIGDEVQVIKDSEIHLAPVFAFIHRQTDVMQEFLKINTTKNKILKITGDHLLFVEKTGQATAIPARDVKIGDTVYVREEHAARRDLVQSISTVYEKGVYAPVTLSGTILVNDVHTSCYFDVLSHEWSHRAMGVARAVYYVSPWMVQWISAVGEKDGFPGWCRLAHKMLTFLE